MISIISPFFNEENIIEEAIEKMILNLKNLREPWELIVVNDGSVDESQKIAESLSKKNPQLRVIGYPINQGRGFALRTGIEAAMGDIIITTEIDCSWGDRIVSDIVDKLNENPEVDFVIASTNLPEGGYTNVPYHRVLISKFGNLVLRVLYGGGITMYTGMTRGYRKNVIKNVPFLENGKEFHLEVIHKLRMLGRKFSEVPAVLSWQKFKQIKNTPSKRKSSSRIKLLVKSHMIFGISTQPFNYLIGFSVICFISFISFLTWGFINFLNQKPSIFLAILSCLFFLISIFSMFSAVITYQNSALHREILNFLVEYKKYQNEPDTKIDLHKFSTQKADFISTLQR
jgi:glycosyltransferase involved in cell wall biosynthesis